MGMNDRELGHVVAALAPLVGQPVTAAWQPRRDRVLLQIGDRILLLVPRGPWARMHTVAQRPANPPRPFSFQGALRAHFTGRITALRKHPTDRIVDLELTDGVRLHLRLTGRSGGLWLLRGDRVIAAIDGPAPPELPPIPETPPRDDPPRFAPVDDEDWDRAAQRWFARAERATTTEDRRVTVGRRLERALDRAVRLRRNLDDDLDKAAKAPEIRLQADTLAAHLHEVRRGVDQVALPDLEDPDRTHWIALDPSLAPAQNMERLYAKVRRLDRVGEHVIVRMDQLDRDIAALRSAIDRVATTPIEALPELERLIPKEPRRALATDGARPYTTWTGPRGERVLVGRNAAGNRKLTFQVARGDDFWMHVRSRPGAHVLIPSRKDHPPPLELLLAAAQIALIHAKIAVGERADIQYTRARHVRAIPGETARVIVDDERVLHVARDPGALLGWTHD